MQVFLQTFVNAISVSLIYILFALGLTLLLGVFSTFVFCHGELFMLATFVTYFIYGQWDLPYYLAFPAAVASAVFVGLVIEKGIFYPMRDRHHLDPALASFGVLIIMQTGALVLWGGMPKGVPPVVKGQIDLGGVIFPLERLPIIIGGLVMLIFLIFFVQRTKLGLAIRAVQQDPEAATLQGMNIPFLRIVTWIIAMSLVAVAGVLMAPVIFIDPFIGDSLIIKGFTVVIVGGLGSVFGATIGGFALGFLDSFGMTYLGTYSYMFAFSIIILVLLLRPQGIIGRL